MACHGAQRCCAFYSGRGSHPIADFMLVICLQVEIRWEDILADLQARAAAAAAANADASGTGGGEVQSSGREGRGMVGERKDGGRLARWQGGGGGCFDAEMMDEEEEEEGRGGRVGGGMRDGGAADGMVDGVVGPPPPSSSAACDTNGDATPGATAPSTSARPCLAIDEMADKMDGLMDLTFQHVQRRHAQGHRQQVGREEARMRGQMVRVG